MRRTVLHSSSIYARAALLQNIANNFFTPRATTELQCVNMIIDQIDMKMIQHHGQGVFDEYYLSSSYLLYGESLINNYWFGLRKFWKCNHIRLDEDLLLRNMDATTPELVPKTDEAWSELVHLNLWVLALTDQRDNLIKSKDHLKAKRTFNDESAGPAEIVIMCLGVLLEYMYSEIRKMRR